MSIHGQTGASWPHMPPVPPPGLPGAPVAPNVRRSAAWFKVARREDVPTLVTFILHNQAMVLGEAMCLEFPAQLQFQNDAAGKKLIVDHVVVFWNCPGRRVGHSADVAVGRYSAKLVCHSDRKDPPFVVQLLASPSASHRSAPPDFLSKNLATHPSWIHLVKLWQTFLHSAPPSAAQAPVPVVPPPVHASLSAAPWGSPLSQAAMDPRYFQDSGFLSYVQPYLPPPPPVAAPASPVDAAAAQAAAQAAAHAAARAAQVAAQNLWSQPASSAGLPASPSPGSAARALTYDTPPATPESSSGGAPSAQTAAPVDPVQGAKRPPPSALSPAVAKKPADHVDLVALAQKVAQLEAANSTLAEQLNSVFPELEARLDTSFSEVRAQVSHLEAQVAMVQQSGDALSSTVSTLSTNLSAFQSETETVLAAHRLAIDSATSDQQ